MTDFVILLYIFTYSINPDDPEHKDKKFGFPPELMDTELYAPLALCLAEGALRM